MVIVKTRKSRVSQKIFFIPKTVQDYGNRTADTFLVMSELHRRGILSLGGSYYLYVPDPFWVPPPNKLEERPILVLGLLFVDFWLISSL